MREEAVMRDELIALVAHRAGVDLKKTRAVVTAMFGPGNTTPDEDRQKGIIEESIISGRNVLLRGFGTFYECVRSSRREIIGRRKVAPGRKAKLAFRSSHATDRPMDVQNAEE